MIKPTIYDKLLNLICFSPEIVAKGAIHVIKYGPSGSVWVVEHKKLLMVTQPKRESYQTKILDL